MMKKQWFRKKWVVVLIHTLIWILFFSLPYLLRPANNQDGNHDHQQPAETTVSFIISRINDLMLISFFYLNSLVLIPRLFYRKKYAAYLLMVLACFAVFSFISFQLQLQFLRKDIGFTFSRHVMFAVFVFLFMLACSIAYKTITDKIKSDNLVRERENENLKTELSLLRMQVSPHFMFNVLNNMVALARKKSDLLEPSLIKLSSLMRYMLYETGESRVSLERETDYLQSYIDLQMQRFGKNVSLDVNMPAPDKQYDIEPMLLIPFVENAFKHGTGMEKTTLFIFLEANYDNLTFTVSNSFDPASAQIKDKASGIGLANVQRRLELLYPHKHQLIIRKNDDTFTVSLQINLS